VVNTDSDLQSIQARHRSWAIVQLDDGSYRAMREWWGNQQIIRVLTLSELDARLSALPPGHPIPDPSGQAGPPSDN
jgi:hypothetical protein